AGTGVNCDPAAITIRAHAADHSVFAGYNGTITLSTSTAHGDWSLASGSGTLTNSGGGSATYAFAAADNGVAALKLANTYAETVDIDVTDGTASESASEDDAID